MRAATRHEGATLAMVSTLLLLTGGAAPALGAEFSFRPSLSLGEEYNDNVFDSADAKRSDFITRVQPGAALVYRTPALAADLAYSFSYRNYARGTRGDEQNHTLNFRGGAELVDNFFFLDLSDTLSRVSLDVARDVTGESQFLNQTDQNRASISPYLLWHPGDKTVLKTGYRYTDTRYWTVEGNASGIDKLEHRGFAELSYEPSARLSLSALYSFSYADSELIDYRQHDLSTGFRYEYSEKSFLFGAVGNSWLDFSSDLTASHLFWNAGISHDFGFLVATLETLVQYTEDPLTASTKETTHSARLEKALAHGSMGLTASRSEYDVIFDPLAGDRDRRKTAFAGFWRYEFSPRLKGNLSLAGDKVTGPTVNGFPYHLSGQVGASYAFNYDINAALTYNYVDYRRELGSASDARQTNRVLLELRKVF